MTYRYLVVFRPLVSIQNDFEYYSVSIVENNQEMNFLLEKGVLFFIRPIPLKNCHLKFDDICNYLGEQEDIKAIPNGYVGDVDVICSYIKTAILLDLDTKESRLKRKTELDNKMIFNINKYYRENKTS